MKVSGPPCEKCGLDTFYDFGKYYCAACDFGMSESTWLNSSAMRGKKVLNTESIERGNHLEGGDE